MATDQIPNLWPTDEIVVDVLPPLVILRAQASNLRLMTKGILEAEINTLRGSGGRLQHQLEILVPALEHYRRRLLTATHDENMVYPVYVDDETPEVDTANALLGREVGDLISAGMRGVRKPVRCSTQDVFIETLQQILRSSTVKSLVQSLIARSNEIRASA